MANPQEYGLYVPSSYVFDVQQIQQADVNSAEFKELLVRLYQNINSMCIALNLKDSGYYNTQEFVNGQMWFPNPNYNSTTAVYPAFRQVYRTVVNFGTLPAAGTKSVAHNVPYNPAYSGTRIYVTATDPVGLTEIPVPFSSAVDIAHNIQLDVDATNVNITTGGHDYSNYTICYVVLEYIKS